MGVARCSASMPTPTPPIMSVSARTTTYVSAAARETATAAVARSALGAGDRNRGTVVRERHQVGRVGAGEERALERCRAQLVGVGEAVADRIGARAVPEVEQLVDPLARQGAVDLAEHLPAGAG